MALTLNPFLERTLRRWSHRSHLHFCPLMLQCAPRIPTHLGLHQALESLGCRKTPSLTEKSATFSAVTSNKTPLSSSSGSSDIATAGAEAGMGVGGSVFSAVGITTATSSTATAALATAAAGNGGCALPAEPFLAAIDELGPALTSLGVL